MTTTSVQSKVLVKLRDLILKGNFAPGERLAEIPLAERLGTSRTPVRIALATLEQEGLIKNLAGGGYEMRQYTTKEIKDAIRVRGMLEGMAARLVAEQGATRNLLRQLQELLEEGDEILDRPQLDMDSYAGYVEMNNQIHSLIIAHCDNVALVESLTALNRRPFAAPSALLPMQSSIGVGHVWMKFAHIQHHLIVDAIRSGEGARAQALCQEHVEIPIRNLDYAIDNPDLAAKVLPNIKIVP